MKRTDIVLHNSDSDDGPDDVKLADGLEVHLETRNGTRISGLIRKVSEEAILVYQPHREAAVWIRRDDISMASNKPFWI